MYNWLRSVNDTYGGSTMRAHSWDNHLVNWAFSNFNFSEPSASCAYLKTEALILEYLNAFHKANTVASTSLSRLNWGMQCTKTNASLWLRQFTYFEWGASWRSHLCRPDLSPDNEWMNEWMKALFTLKKSNSAYIQKWKRYKPRIKTNQIRAKIFKKYKQL